MKTDNSSLCTSRVLLSLLRFTNGMLAPLQAGRGAFGVCRQLPPISQGDKAAVHAYVRGGSCV